MARDMVFVTVLGGANLDLTEAELADPQSTTLTKVSLVGGVSLQVPHTMDVEVEGFRLFGGVRIEPAERTGPATAFLGKQFTVADAYLFVMLTWAETTGIDLSSYRQLTDLRDRLAAMPSVKRAMSMEGLH